MIIVLDFRKKTTKIKKITNNIAHSLDSSRRKHMQFFIIEMNRSFIVRNLNISKRKKM